MSWKRQVSSRMSIYPSEVTLHLGHCLHQMAVDRVSVDRIVEAGRGSVPTKNPSADASGEVEGFPDRQQVGPGGQHLQQRVPTRLRPGCRELPALLAEVVGSDGGEDQPRCAAGAPARRPAGGSPGLVAGPSPTSPA